MLVAAVAQEPLLLVGPPGTAKSDLVLKFKDALGLGEDDYFEYMLTRFTEPSEIIGPIDISQLREGRYIRREQGKLPTARLGFLDEIFKSNSAILNILLTIINERKFYQDGVPQPVRLRVLFAATNEIPEQAELAALKDRFCLKAESRSVQEQHFTELIDAGIQGEVYKGLNQKPWVEGHCSLDDVLKANRYLTYLFARRHRSGRGEEQNDRQVFFPAEVFDEFQRLVKTLVREDQIFISDRKLVKLYKLFRVRAWLFTGGTVSATTCACWRTSARRTRRSSCCAKRCRRSWERDNQGALLGEKRSVGSICSTALGVETEALSGALPDLQSRRRNH